MMKLVFVLMATLLVGTTLAQAAVPVKRGVSPRTAAQIKQVVQATGKKESDALAARLKQAGEACHSQLANERKAFNDALAKQPEFGAMKKEYDALLASFKDPKANQTEKQQQELQNRARSFAAKYGPVQTRAYALAKIDDNRVRSVITANLTRYLGARFKVTKNGSGWSAIAEAPVEEPAPATPSITCFNPPYDEQGLYNSYEGQSSLGSSPSIRSNKEDGEIFVYLQTAIAEHKHGNAWVGSYVSFPEGTYQLKTTTTIEAKCTILAMAAAGLSMARADLTAGVWDGHNSLSGDGVDLGVYVAPIAWIAISDEQLMQYKIEHTTYVQGDEFLLTSLARAISTTVGGAIAVALVDGTVQDICVEVAE